MDSVRGMAPSPWSRVGAELVLENLYTELQREIATYCHHWPCGPAVRKYRNTDIYIRKTDKYSQIDGFKKYSKL